MKMVIRINCVNDYWKSEVIEGESGTGDCGGGKYNSLDEYKQELIKTHTYSYGFFNYGYKHAKINL